MHLESLESFPCPKPEQLQVSAIASPKDNLKLRSALWQSTHEKPAGTIVIMPGYTEFIEKYYEVIGQLLDRGYSVLITDWRGQGGSERLLEDKYSGYVDSYDDFIGDISYVLDHRLKDLPRPHGILAHSMGGHLALRLMQEQTDRFDQAVVVAPMLSITRMPQSLIKMVARLKKVLKTDQDYFANNSPPDLEADRSYLSSNKELVEKALEYWRQFDYLQLGSPTIGWVQQAQRSIDAITKPEAIAQIQTPTLLCSAELDSVVNPRHHQQADAVGNPNIKLQNFPTAQHEILLESDSIRQEFWRSFDAFMGAN